jgi:hypothetical protein
MSRKKLMQSAITVFPNFAHLIASWHKTLELRSTRLLRPGQRVVVCSGAPEGLTLALVECTAVHNVADLRVADVLRRACVTELDPRWKFALELRVIRLLELKRVKANFGVWVLRTQRHSKDAGYVL